MIKGATCRIWPGFKVDRTTAHKTACCSYVETPLAHLAVESLQLTRLSLIQMNKFCGSQF